MRYSDVAEKYYKETKNRILENVLAAEENSGERSRVITIGEKNNIEKTENEERNIMTNNSAKIRSNKGMIAAACAVFIMGSGIFAMNSLKAANDSGVSSRPDNMRETLVTTADEDTSSDVSEYEQEADTSAEAEEDSRKETISRTDVKVKKDNSRDEVKEKTSDNAEKNNDSKPADVPNDENDKGGHAQAGNDYVKDDSSAAEKNYLYDDVEFHVDEQLSKELKLASMICEGTITSKEIYGRTASEEFKPLSEYPANELDNIRRLYFRCTVKLDGTCFKGQQLKEKLDDTEQYIPATGDMELVIPIGKKLSDDEFDEVYASRESEIDDPDLYNVGEKMVVQYDMSEYDGKWSIVSEDAYRYDYNDHMYHNISFYVPNISYYEGYDYHESMMNWLISAKVGNNVSEAEDWLNFLGEDYTIRYEPSKRSSGSVLYMAYSLPDNCYLIFAAE